MRLTAVLGFPRYWINLRGAAWYKARKKAIVNNANYEKILAAGYNVVEATDFVKSVSPYNHNYEALPDLKPLFPTPPKMDTSHPDWHDNICKVFNDTTFPIEGVTQALAFTKGVKMSDDLPEPILERAKSIEFTQEEDNMARRIVQQAFLWDSYLEKLPKLRDLELPNLVPRNEYGIPWKRSNEIMINNFIRLIESKLPLDLTLSRIMCPQEELRVNMERHGFPIQFKLNAIAHILSTSLTKPIVSKPDVEKSTGLPLTDIYPFWSTANFEEVNIYKDKDYFTVKPTSKFPHIHTSVFSHHIPGSHTHIYPRWNDDRFAGTTILYNFATALSVAKRKFGLSMGDVLPEPITTQVIHLTGKQFQFSVFQLNTLNLEDRDPTSIKNHVWITKKIDLFSELKNYYGKETFEGYNPDIIKTIAAMYLS